MTSGRRRLNVFFSYSHKDEDLRDELEAHLAMLQNLDIIETWHDRKIPPGDSWNPKIAEEIERADLILLLISANFLSSKFCFGKEMKRAMERHVAGETYVIPILLKDCDWEGAPFSSVQGLPRDFRPITSWSNRDEALTDVAKGIRWRCELLAGERRPVEILSPAPEQGRLAVPMSLSLQGTFHGQLVNHLSTQGRFDQCRIDSGTKTTLTVNLDSVPAGGYAGWDAHVFCDSMIYEQLPKEFAWPDAVFPAGAFTPPGSYFRGAAVGIGSPASYYQGALLELSFRCPFEHATHPHSHDVYLVAYGGSLGGSGVIDEALNVMPAASIGRAELSDFGSQNVAAALRINCQP